MKTILLNEIDTHSKESKQESTKEANLLNLFEQYSHFAQATSDWLEAATIVVISEVSIQGRSATYYVLVQKQSIIVLLDTGANIYQSYMTFFYSASKA